MNDMKKEGCGCSEPGCSCHFKGFKHLWKYYKVHVKLRSGYFRSYVAFLMVYLVFMGFLLMHFHDVGVMPEVYALVMSLVFAAITASFHCLDRRNHRLMHLARDGFVELEKNGIKDCKGCSQFNLFTRQDQAHVFSQGNCAIFVYLSAYILIGLVVLWAIVHLAVMA